MKPWAIVAIVLLVLAGSGVGIYFAVRSKPELSERNRISAMFKQGDNLSIGPRRCYVTTGGFKGENISLAEAQKQCWDFKTTFGDNKRPCVGVKKYNNPGKNNDHPSGWIPCLAVWKENLSLDPETYIIEDRLKPGCLQQTMWYLDSKSKKYVRGYTANYDKKANADDGSCVLQE